MSGLGLVPNEIVGWRIKPDWYNYTVVLVKRHGASSKKAGQEYEESIAYCATLEGAVRWMVNHVTRVEAERRQDAEQAISGSIASAEAMMAAMAAAQAAAFAAVAELEEKLIAAGLRTPKQVTHFVGGTAPAEAADAA